MLQGCGCKIRTCSRCSCCLHCTARSKTCAAVRHMLHNANRLYFLADTGHQHCGHPAGCLPQGGILRAGMLRNIRAGFSHQSKLWCSSGSNDCEFFNLLGHKDAVVSLSHRAGSRLGPPALAYLLGTYRTVADQLLTFVVCKYRGWNISSDICTWCTNWSLARQQPSPNGHASCMDLVCNPQGVLQLQDMSISCTSLLATTECMRQRGVQTCLESATPLCLHLAFASTASLSDVQSPPPEL